MNDLVEELNETCILSILRKTDLKRIVLHEVQSSNELSVRTSIEKDAYNAATGRLALAFLPSQEIEWIVKQFGLPQKSIWREASTFDKLLMELKRIKEEGIVYQYDSNHIVGLAIPIVKEEKVIASLGIYMPEIRYQGEMKAIALNRLNQAANEINNSLSNFKITL
jgi:IclR family KDG regulon transcriptional repressor